MGARRIKGRVPSTKYWHQSVFDENVKYHIKAPTNGVRRAVNSMQVIDDKTGLSRAATHVEATSEGVRRCCISIAGYENADGTAIDDGETLVEHGEDEYLAEVYVEFMGQGELLKPEKKESDESSASTEAVTDLPDGTAESVDEKDSTSAEDASEGVALSP